MPKLFIPDFFSVQCIPIFLSGIKSSDYSIFLFYLLSNMDDARVYLVSA